MAASANTSGSSLPSSALVAQSIRAESTAQTPGWVNAARAGVALAALLVAGTEVNRRADHIRRTEGGGRLKAYGSAVVGLVEDTADFFSHPHG